MRLSKNQASLGLKIPFFCLAFFLLPSVFSQALEDLNSGRIIVREFQDLGDLGKDIFSVAWSADGRLLLVDKKVAGRFHGIFSIDVESKNIKSLASGGIGGGNDANSASPTLSNDGHYLLFCTQLSASNKFNRTTPGYGLHNDLWTTDLRSGNSQCLYRNGFSMSNPKGTVFPFFSSNSKKVAWTTILGQARSGSIMGRRGVSMAEFRLGRNGVPELGKIEELVPGNQQDFYEAYSFTPDDKKILLAANLSERQPWFGMDLYYLDLDTREYQALTDTLGVWDRFASLSPKGEKIAWASSMGLTTPNFGVGGRLWEKYLSSELWLMNKDGSEKKRLTGFNQRGNKEYTGVRTVVGMSAWHPDGNQLALVLHREGRNYELESSCLILKLGDTFVPVTTPTPAATPAPAVTPSPASEEDAGD
jgi:Tol biopolymer transport system component